MKGAMYTQFHWAYLTSEDSHSMDKKTIDFLTPVD